MSGSCREAFLVVWEWSRGHTGCPRVVGRPFGMSGSGREAFQMSGSNREALPDVQVWLGGPPGYQGVVGNPSWMCGGSPGSQGVVGRPYRMSGKSWETLLYVR